MRWTAVVTYRSEAGPVDVTLDFDEISDLEDMIERGPSFLSIDSIVIKYAYDEAGLTIEAAEAL